MEVLEVW